MTLDVWTGYYTLDSANQQLKDTADLLKTAEQNAQVALGRLSSAEPLTDSAPLP
ncbi:MAG TPA: hypothetical protein VK251_07815 [Steroidobacteraceae bacterium]|nr:hypothetical protein [Steroidobacteraceae bacterium]